MPVTKHPWEGVQVPHGAGADKGNEAAVDRSVFTTASGMQAATPYPASEGLGQEEPQRWFCYCCWSRFLKMDFLAVKKATQDIHAP